MMERPGLIFVYNSDSGFLNTLFDIGHKLVSPATYSCRLCSLTHSTFRMRRDWREFVGRLGVPVEFLHRDEFIGRYGPASAELPAVYLKSESGPVLSIRHDEIGACGSLGDLQHLIKKKILNEMATMGSTGKEK